MGRKVLQLANWDLKMIQRHLHKIKQAGFTSIQTSPLQTCKPIWTDNGRIKKYSSEWYNQIHKEFWKFYQPYTMTIGNELGTWQDYINLCNEAHNIGLEIIVDVVLRHVAGEDDGSSNPHKNCDKWIISRKDFFMNDNRKADNFGDREGMVKGMLSGLPTLNYENKELQEKIYLPFLKSLLQYGDGIRFDMAHHFRLPSEGGNFFQNIVNNLPKDKYITGECNNANDIQLEEYSKYIIPIIPYGRWWGHKNAQFYFENHDDVLSFMKGLAMTSQYRLEQWENVLQRGGDGLYYARQNDDTIFSERIKRINNTYK